MATTFKLPQYFDIYLFITTNIKSYFRFFQWGINYQIWVWYYIVTYHHKKQKKYWLYGEKNPNGFIFMILLFMKTYWQFQNNTSRSVRSTLSTDIETTRSVHVFMVNKENPDTEDGHKDTEIKSGSTTTIKSARIAIILLSMVSVFITLLIISTFLPEKYQIMKFKQKEVLCNI